MAALTVDFPGRRMPRLRYRDTKPPWRLEGRFLRLWESLGGPPLEKEFRFHPGRRWRADFAHLPSRTLIEVEGGFKPSVACCYGFVGAGASRQPDLSLAMPSGPVWPESFHQPSASP